MIEVLRAKLHGLKVTQCNLEYHGSITIDAYLLSLVDIPIHSFVNVWNKNNGERIKTYVQKGARHSGVVCINGAAARKFEVGDEIIVAQSSFVKLDEYFSYVLTIADKNKPDTLMIYDNLGNPIKKEDVWKNA